MMVMFVIKMINSDDDCKDYDSDNIDHDRDYSGDQDDESFHRQGMKVFDESFCRGSYIYIFAGRGSA